MNTLPQSRADNSQIGRIIVLPVLPLKDNGSVSKEPVSDEGDPVMLVALNAKESVDWDRLRISVCCLSLASKMTCADGGSLRPKNSSIISKSL